MERIRCPAPLPEDLATPVLTRMLASAPYQAPAREGQEESENTLDDICFGGKSDTESREINLSSPEDRGERGASIPSPSRRKRAASEGWEGRSPKRGKMPPSSGLGLERDAVEQLQQGDKPSAKP